MNKKKIATVGVLLVLAAGGLSGCGGDDTSASPASTSSAPTGSASPSPPAAPSASPSPSVSPGQDPSPTTTVTGPRTKDPVAPATFPPVVRGGETPRPSVSAPPAAFAGTVAYPDGVALQVARVSSGEATGQLAGDLAGATTTLSVVLKNDGTSTVDLSQVVVTLVYGRPGRLAKPVYEDDNVDFSGLIAPGKSAKAVYTFLVPRANRSQLTMHVDFDATHVAAVFSSAT